MLLRSAISEWGWFGYVHVWVVWDIEQLTKIQIVTVIYVYVGWKSFCLVKSSGVGVGDMRRGRCDGAKVGDKRQLRCFFFHSEIWNINFQMWFFPQIRMFQAHSEVVQNFSRGLGLIVFYAPGHGLSCKRQFIATLWQQRTGEKKNPHTWQWCPQHTQSLWGWRDKWHLIRWEIWKRLKQRLANNILYVSWGHWAHKCIPY